MQAFFLLLFTSLTATYAQKSQNSDFTHVCLGFITRKQRENTSRRQRVNSNQTVTFGMRIWAIDIDNSVNK